MLELQLTNPFAVFIMYHGIGILLTVIVTVIVAYVVTRERSCRFFEYFYKW